ncbi:helix-turn-helix transcriptional regulator [Vitiosangium sp. GDMCC 1.1324]|uniref:helix-turn-helix transcriptional regulator n=1 Tax=Vitiosangium sp. (strain GDMCC 1.1324) TaxID=2138576 RepID=UPI001E4D05F1|nr:helix-turn-helix transcriptional regulator [Vitiosangium sp. GDMCC 1.1324]
MNSQDQRLLGDLRALIDTVDLGVDVLPTLVGALREAMHAERGLAYGVDIGPERYQASFTHISGFLMTTEEAHSYLDGFVGTRRDPWGYFNPACPQPTQRNRVLHFQAPGTNAAPTEPTQDERLAPWKKLGIASEEQARMHAQVRTAMGGFLQSVGLDRMVFLRMLVCDGPALLGWVGTIRSEPFGAREQHLMRELIPSLQRRMKLDARLRETGVLHAALEATMEAMSQPAFVVTSTGRVAHANTAGRAWLEHGAGLVAEALKKYLRGEPGGEQLAFSPLRLAGVAPHYLATVQGESAQAFARVHSLGASWGLTARETEVLGRLVRGESNKAIALHLGCAERTVEVHVTRVLAKAQVESRSALIARCFLAT